MDAGLCVSVEDGRLAWLPSAGDTEGPMRGTDQQVLLRKGRKGRLLEKRGHGQAFHHGPSPGPLLDPYLLLASLPRGLRQVLVPEGNRWPSLQPRGHFQALRLTANLDAALSYEMAAPSCQSQRRRRHLSSGGCAESGVASPGRGCGRARPPAPSPLRRSPSCCLRGELFRFSHRRESFPFSEKPQ